MRVTGIFRFFSSIPSDIHLRFRDIPSGGSIDIQIPTKGCEGSPAEVKKLEHVLLTVSFIHRRRGDVSILLTSPSGTKNEMLSTRHYDDSKEGLDNWGFMTVHCWGEWWGTNCRTRCLCRVGSSQTHLALFCFIFHSAGVSGGEQAVELAACTELVLLKPILLSSTSSFILLG